MSITEPSLPVHIRPNGAALVELTVQITGTVRVAIEVPQDAITNDGQILPEHFGALDRLTAAAAGRAREAATVERTQFRRIEQTRATMLDEIEVLTAGGEFETRSELQLGAELTPGAPEAQMPGQTDLEFQA